MNDSTSSKFPRLLASAALLLTLGTGCARTVDFAVTRPAMLNLQPTGNTVAVGPIAANGQREAAADVTGELQGRIAHSLNPSIRLLADGAGVVIDGSIMENRYDTHSETVSQTCTRTVDDGTDSNGTPQSHTESYDCSYEVEVGVGKSRVALRVVEATGERRVLFIRVYDSSDSVSSPSKDDAATLMHRLRVANVEQFAKVILPWQDTVSERFKDCEGDARCKKGFELVKTGDLPGADALFTQVIGAHETAPVPPDRAKAVAEAFYNRGVTRAHQQRYAEAAIDLQRAIVLQPKRAKWPAELASVQEMARDKEALRAQGAAP
jgi:hypothetical protein